MKDLKKKTPKPKKVKRKREPTWNWFQEFVFLRKQAD